MVNIKFFRNLPKKRILVLLQKLYIYKHTNLTKKTLNKMDFNLSEEQLMIQQAARDFAQTELLPGVIERDRGEKNG